MTRGSLTTAGAVLLAALACNATTEPTIEEAAVIWATAVEPALTSAQLALEQGDSVVQDAGLCPGGNRHVSGEVDSAAVNLTHTLNGCTATAPNGPGQFLMSGTVQITGSVGAPSISGEIRWSSTVTGETGACTPVTSSSCQ